MKIVLGKPQEKVNEILQPLAKYVDESNILSGNIENVKDCKEELLNTALYTSLYSTSMRILDATSEDIYQLYTFTANSSKGKEISREFKRIAFSNYSDTVRACAALIASENSFITSFYNLDKALSVKLVESCIEDYEFEIKKGNTIRATFKVSTRGSRKIVVETPDKVSVDSLLHQIASYIMNTRKIIFGRVNNAQLTTSIPFLPVNNFSAFVRLLLLSDNNPNVILASLGFLFGIPDINTFMKTTGFFAFTIGDSTYGYTDLTKQFIEINSDELLAQIMAKMSGKMSLF